MEKINHNVLVFDEEKFSSVAKSLYKQLSSQETKLTLSKTQEALAKSLGFRNLNGIKTFWNKIEKSPITVSDLSFKGFSASKWYSLLLFLMKDKDDVWVQKSLPLMKAILPLLVYEEKEQGVPITAKTIRQGLNKLKNKIQILNYVSEYPEEVSIPLRDYFDNVPDYKSDTVQEEQFLYLFMQWTHVLDTLQEIEKNDIILVPKKLIKMIQADKVYKDSLKQVKKDDRVIEISDASDEIKNLAALMEQFWRWPYLGNGWLESDEECLYSFINLRIYENNVEDIKLSEFLIYSSALLRGKQLYKYQTFLNPILKNIEESKKYSEKLVKFIDSLR